MLKQKVKRLEERQLPRQLMNGQEIRQRLKRGRQEKNLEGLNLVETVLIGALIVSLGMMMTIQD